MRMVICLQILRTFLNRWKNYFYQLLDVHDVSDVRQKYIQLNYWYLVPVILTLRLLMFQLKKYKSAGSDQILAEWIQTGGETLWPVVHIQTTSTCNKEELPEQWKESISVPIHKMDDKTDCNNYRGISLLSTSYKYLSNIPLSRLSPYMDEIIGDH
jgi:hypothetical protein